MSDAAANTVEKFITLDHDETSHMKHLCFFRSGEVHVSLLAPESSVSIKFTRAQALALAEAILKNVKQLEGVKS